MKIIVLCYKLQEIQIIIFVLINVKNHNILKNKFIVLIHVLKITNSIINQVNQVYVK